MIENVVDRLQRWCDQRDNPTAGEVAEKMRRESVVLQGEEELADDRPIIGSKFFITDTTRTQSCPDGHFSTQFVTAIPFMDGTHRRWKFQKGRPSDDLDLYARRSV